MIPPAIPYVRDFEFEYGRPDQVSPLIRRVVARNPGPFTFTGTGTYIVGYGKVAVIDPGPAMDDHLDALLATLAGETVSHILVTHTHADHSPLARPLARATGAPVCAAPPPQPAEAGGTAHEEADDDGFRPDVVLEDGDTLRGPGWTLETVATPGHASNHLCFALAEENALFSGDHVMGWSTTIVGPPDGDMADYYASLERIAARGFDTLWPTHGPPITEPAPFLAAYAAHRRYREEQILQQVAAGRGRIADMVPVIYAAVDQRLWPAAAHSVLAHLVHLTRIGAVRTDGEPDLQSAYRLA
ncbi:MAG TPA: MBL fold metallo-hydrolase [Caulobacteraceae bacterium]|nr:MBL fold metallo-hydrolase [Caulobacteraceae bacterium]